MDTAIWDAFIFGYGVQALNELFRANCHISCGPASIINSCRRRSVAFKVGQCLQLQATLVGNKQNPRFVYQHLFTASILELIRLPACEKPLESDSPGIYLTGCFNILLEAREEPLSQQRWSEAHDAGVLVRNYYCVPMRIRDELCLRLRHMLNKPKGCNVNYGRGNKAN